MTLAIVELTADEIDFLLAQTLAQRAELERVRDGLEEAEGMDAGRHNILKQIRPRLEMFDDLALKLEGARKDAQAP